VTCTRQRRVTATFSRLTSIIKRNNCSTVVQDGVYLFKPQTMSWLSSGVARDWPDARAIFVNDDRTVYAWINQKDHLRLISWSTNNAHIDLRSVINTLFRTLSSVSRLSTFVVVRQRTNRCVRRLARTDITTRWDSIRARRSLRLSNNMSG
jgi:hypothetical protein